MRRLNELSDRFVGWLAERLFGKHIYYYIDFESGGVVAGQGRNQTEGEAKEIDDSVKNLLDSGNVAYYSVDADIAVEEIYGRLKERNYII